MHQSRNDHLQTVTTDRNTNTSHLYVIANVMQLY